LGDPSAPPQGPAGEPSPSSQTKVLIIDDDASLRALVADALIEGGFSTIAGANAEEALRRLEDLQVRAVLLDLHLPGLSGRDLLPLLKRARPEVPVIVLTAERSVAEVVACMKLGASEYLVKPFDGGRLLSTVRGLVDAAPVRAASSPRES